MQSITAPVRLLLETSAAKAARRGNGDGGPVCDIGSYKFLFSGSTPVQAPQEPIPLPPVVPDPIEPVIPDPVTTDPVTTEPDTTELETTEPVIPNPMTSEPEPISSDQQAEVTSCWGISTF
jgi:hypothetical protein